MGKRGRTPKPAELVDLEARRGTLADRKNQNVVPKDQLPLLGDQPTVPIYSEANATHIYSYVVTMLKGAELLRATDEPLVRMLAESLERYTRLSKMCRGKEVVGGLINGAFAAMHVEQKAVLSMLKELGMTPASRTRLLMEMAYTKQADSNTKGFDFDQ